MFARSSTVTTQQQQPLATSNLASDVKPVEGEKVKVCYDIRRKYGMREERWALAPTEHARLAFVVYCLQGNLWADCLSRVAVLCVQGREVAA